MPTYTHLFDALGWAGIACTIFAAIVAFVLWWLDRKGILRFGGGEPSLTPEHAAASPGTRTGD